MMSTTWYTHVVFTPIRRSWREFTQLKCDWGLLGPHRRVKSNLWKHICWWPWHIGFTERQSVSSCKTLLFSSLIYCLCREASSYPWCQKKGSSTDRFTNNEVMPDFSQPWIPHGFFPRVTDIFQDRSILIVDVPGHLSGQINFLACAGPGKYTYYLGVCVIIDVSWEVREILEIGRWIWPHQLHSYRQETGWRNDRIGFAASVWGCWSYIGSWYRVERQVTESISRFGAN